MRGTAKQTAPRRHPLGFPSDLGATTEMAEVEEEREVGGGAEGRRSRKRRRNFSASPRGLAIFQWDLLEHHSKALRPPGQSSPFALALPPRSVPLDTLVRAPGPTRTRERIAQERRALARLVSSPLISFRLVPSRLGARRGHSSANYFILTLGPSDCACLSLDSIPVPPSGHRSFSGLLRFGTRDKYRQLRIPVPRELCNFRTK